MYESWQTNYNEIKEDIERFERMDSGEKSFFFDVHTIESIFDFFTDKYQFDKAEKILSIGILQHPNATSLKVKQAIILMEKGDDKNAVQLLQNLSKIETSNPEVYLNLGLLYLRNDHTEEAETCFTHALEIAFDDREEILLDIGVFFNQQEAFKKAIQFLKPACNEYPENENLLFELAYAYDKEFDFNNGLNTYLKVIDLNPFSENAWYNLGILYTKDNEFEKAINCYDYALAIMPDHGEALFNKANALVSLNKPAEAIDCYIEYISLGFDTVLPYHYIADCLEQMGQAEESLRYYRLTTTKTPDYMPAWLNYLATLINREMVEEAIEASTVALNHHHDIGELWYLRARALLLNNDKKQAQKAFEMALEDDPDSLRNLYELYQLKIELNPKASGFDFLKKWKQKYPESPAVHYLFCAHYLLEERNLNKAVHYLDLALEADPGIDLFLDLFPKVEKMIKKSKKLSQVIDKHLNHEL